MAKDPIGWFCVSDFTYTEPKKPGVYAIYVLNYEKNIKKLIYIGTAQNLYTRLKKHEIKKVLNAILDPPEVPYIKCKIIMDIKNRFFTEVKLIRKLKPRGNY